jgi:hypothetical protein
MELHDRRIDVFFYGLFMNPELLRSKGIAPTNIRAACVRRFALRIGERATLLPSPGGRAYGFVMELAHSEIDQLYSEPSVSACRPEAVLVEVEDGSQLPALCFNLIAVPELHEANLEYAAKLRELARRLGLPLEYVDTIQ